MSRVGKAYKKTVELRKGLSSEVVDSSLITITDFDSTEDYTLGRVDFLEGYGILNPTNGFMPYRGEDRYKDSPVEFDIVNNKIVSGVDIETPAPSLRVGAREELSSTGAGMALGDTAYEVQANILTVPFDSSGSKLPSWPEFIGALSVQEVTQPFLADEETAEQIRFATDLPVAQRILNPVSSVDNQIFSVWLKTGSTPSTNIKIIVELDDFDSGKVIYQSHNDVEIARGGGYNLDPNDTVELKMDNGSGIKNSFDSRDADIKYITLKSSGGVVSLLGVSDPAQFTPWAALNEHPIVNRVTSWLDNTQTTLRNHWSASKIQTELDFKIDDAANVGGFVEVFRDETDTTLNFRTLQSTDGTISITQNADDIDIKFNHQTLLTASSFSNQEPSLLDTELQVEFGAAQGTGSDPVSLAVDGTLTFNESGFYNITLGIQYGRANTNLVAILHFRMLINGAQVGNSATAVLSTDTEDVPFSVTSGFTVEAGDELTMEIIRDSTGTNDGGLFTKSVAAAGWVDSPSASIRVFR